MVSRTMTVRAANRFYWLAAGGALAAILVACASLGGTTGNAAALDGTDRATNAARPAGLGPALTVLTSQIDEAVAALAPVSFRRYGRAEQVGCELPGADAAALYVTAARVADGTGAPAELAGRMEQRWRSLGWRVTRRDDAGVAEVVATTPERAVIRVLADRRTTTVA